MVCHPVTGLADVTLAHMRRVVGRTFHTHDVAGRLVALKLVSVTDMRPQRRVPGDPGPSILEQEGTLVAVSVLGLGSETIPIGERPFGLHFEGPARRPLPNGHYDLELPWLPLPGLHLSPVGDRAAQRGNLLYEAIID